MKQQIIKLTKIVENKGQIEGLPRNPRQIKDEKYKLLKKSIEDDPEMLELRELLVYPHNNKFVVIGGSGSTLIACEQLNRKCYMMELDEHYCDVIIDRWQKLTGKTAVKIEQQ